jgi:RND family efflux transporter MFP subunit
MSRFVKTRLAQTPSTRLAFAASCAVSVSCLFAASLSAVEVEGYTEPSRTVDVAAHDQGILVLLPVRIGDYVEEGQVVAELDDTIQRMSTESAAERKDARGRLNSAEAELRLRTTRLGKLMELRASGYGRKEEVERAQADLEIAAAELQAVRDDLAEFAMQYEKAKAELDRRVVRAPISGYVAERLKEPGEFVAPQEPNVLTIVDLKSVLAKFSMQASLARHLKIGDSVTINFDTLGKSTIGIVDQISPIVDAQSGTIKVKVRIENSDREILSGEQCTIDVPVGESMQGEELETASLAVPDARETASH